MTFWLYTLCIPQELPGEKCLSHGSWYERWHFLLSPYQASICFTVQLKFGLAGLAKNTIFKYIFWQFSAVDKLEFEFGHCKWLYSPNLQVLWIFELWDWHWGWSVKPIWSSRWSQIVKSINFHTFFVIFFSHSLSKTVYH